MPFQPVIGIVINKVNLAKHAMYEYGDYGDYYSRYRGYYGAAYGGGTAGGPPADVARETSGIAKLTRIVPRMK